MNKLNKPTQDVSKIQVATTFQTEEIVLSVCILKDKRLVSGDSKGLIQVYNTAYQSQFHIQHAHDDGVWSLCVLRNGELVSGGEDNKIKVWRINENHYQLIHTLIGHTSYIHKVIELRDGKICSFSFDGAIRIWDNYKCIKTLEVNALSIIEINNFIISVSFFNGELRIWDESAYECIQTIQGVFCCSDNGLSKLDENTLIVGGENSVIYLVDIKTYQIKEFQDDSLGGICCLHVNGDGLAFIGNGKGEIFCYDSSSKKIIFKNKFHNQKIWCIIETEDNQLISFENKTINIYN